MERRTHYQLFLPLLILLLLFVFAGEGHAQKRKVRAKRKAPVKKAEVSKKQQQQEEDEIGAYRRRRIEVIQDRLFNKRNKSEFSLSVGVLPDNPFYFYTGLDVKYTYHFTEYLGLEGNFLYVFDSKKDVLRSIETTFNQTVRADILKFYYGGEFIFTPLYGKFAFLTKSILHWDFFVAIGVGAFNTEIANRFAGNFGVGMHVFFNKWLAGRFDFRNYTYREVINFVDSSSGAVVETGNVVNAKQFQFGISVYFPPL